MYSNRHHRSQPDSSSVGWISNSDVLLFGIGLMFAVATGLDYQAKRHQRAAGTHKAAEASLRNENASLRRSLKASQEELAGRDQRVADLRGQLDRLQVALRTSEETRQSLAANLKELIKQAAEAEESRRELTQALQAALEENKTLVEARRRLLTEKERLAESLRAMRHSKTQLANLQNKFNVVQAQYQETLGTLRQMQSDERRIRTELIGLRGSIKRVAILFDSSGSMRDGGRWDAARRIVATWLEYLEMEQCVLIVFGRDVVALPDDGTLLDLRGEQGDRNRKRLLEFIEQLDPEGGTNTLAALEMAYAYDDLDAILLFTDGAPNDGRSATFDPDVARQIYRLCEQHKDIPINTVGLGDYFQKDLSEFLLTIAEITGGTFMGR